MKHTHEWKYKRFKIRNRFKSSNVRKKARLNFHAKWNVAHYPINTKILYIYCQWNTLMNDKNHQLGKI